MATELAVTSTEQVTPAIRRVWFRNDDLSAFADSELDRGIADRCERGYSS